MRERWSSEKYQRIMQHLARINKPMSDKEWAADWEGRGGPPWKLHPSPPENLAQFPMKGLPPRAMTRFSERPPLAGRLKMFPNLPSPPGTEDPQK